MPDQLKKRRSGWVLLALGALIASLLAVGVNPATAEEETADHKASTSACEGDAQTDRMFTDVSEGHFFRDAINCIAYHRITTGSGDGTTFSPSQDVTRWQMALFIARAATAAGVDLDDAMDAGFTDIGDAPEVSRDAINQLAVNGIIPEATTYRPNDPMTRGEMALFLVGFLDKAAPNVTINEDGAIMLGVGSDATGADDYFADVRALSSPSVDQAAAALFELGVTTGSSKAADVIDPTQTPLDVKFDPEGTVTRGAMAAFITRALAHTSLAPATTETDQTDTDQTDTDQTDTDQTDTDPPEPTGPALTASPATVPSAGHHTFTVTGSGWQPGLAVNVLVCRSPNALTPDMTPEEFEQAVEPISQNVFAYCNIGSLATATVGSDGSFTANSAGHIGPNAVLVAGDAGRTQSAVFPIFIDS